jgi:outer membrane protein assembly factor BamD
MNLSKLLPRPVLFAALGLAFLTSCVHKYATPITKNTQQPDKVLFDQAVKDIEHGRYEVARISLQTLMNTYESSEYLAKAKLAIADSWFREGGVNGMAQADADYRVCNIHYKQMDGSDRDWSQTLRADDECRAVLTQFPNSKFAPAAMQMVRNIQESLAEHEFVVGDFYFKRDMNPAAANRLNAVVDQYPLYSKADEALYEAGVSYERMGPRYRSRAGEMFSRIVKDYPLSARAGEAKKQLNDLEMPIPRPDQEAMAREKYNLENYRPPTMMARATSWLHSGPDVRHASKTGEPTMHDPARTIPVSIPVVNTEEASAAGGGAGPTDVSATTVSGNDNALDKKPDARSSAVTAKPAAQNQALPSNHDAELKKYRAMMAKKQAKLAKKKKKKQHQAEQPASQQNPGAQPASAAASNLTQQK